MKTKIQRKKDKHPKNKWEYHGFKKSLPKFAPSEVKHNERKENEN